MSCSAVYCTSRTTKGGHKNRELSFHVFPKYPEIRAEWLKAVRRDNWQPTKFSRLCSKHFDESCFVEGLSVKKLKPDAVPTIFEGYSTYYQLAVPKRKPSNRITEIDFSPKKRKRLLECGLDPRECNFYSFKLVAKLARVKKIALKRLKQIKKLREANRRLKKKNASLLNVISDLKKENLLNTEDISEKPHSRFNARFVSPLSRQQSRLRAPEERTYFLCLYSGLRKYFIETMVEEVIMRKRRSEK